MEQCEDWSSGYTLYRIYGNPGNGRFLAYIGISKHWLRRMGEHRAEREWWDIVEAIEIENHCCRHHAQQAESAAIRAEKPWFNHAGNPHYVGWW